ncbi:hypothetical protein D3C71_1844840 [compost metagenome]
MKHAQRLAPQRPDFLLDIAGILRAREQGYRRWFERGLLATVVERPEAHALGIAPPQLVAGSKAELLALFQPCVHPRPFSAPELPERVEIADMRMDRGV